MFYHICFCKQSFSPCNNTFLLVGKFFKQHPVLCFHIFQQLVMLIDFDLNILILNHLSTIIVFYYEFLSNDIFDNIFEIQWISNIFRYFIVNVKIKPNIRQNT